MNERMRLPCCVVILSVAAAAMADVPREMTFQGRLAGNGTDPVNIEVRLYDAATGGTPLWSETHPDVPRPNGLFTVNIGSQTTGGIPDAAIDAAEVWMAVSVNGGTELAPRAKLAMAAFAAKSKSAEQLVRPGGFEAALETRLDGGFTATGDDAELFFYPADAAGGPYLQLRSESDTCRFGLEVANPAHGWVMGDHSSGENNKLEFFNATCTPFSISNPCNAAFLNTSNLPTIELQAHEFTENHFGGAFVALKETQGYTTIELDAEVNLFDKRSGKITVRDADHSPDRHIVLDATDAWGISTPALRVVDGFGNEPAVQISTHSHYGQPDRTALEIKAGVTDLDPKYFRVYTSDGDPYSLKARLDGRFISEVLQITGGSDLAEPAHVSDSGLGADAIQPGMVVSIDPENPGMLILATEAYDTKVAGVISGAGGVPPGMIMQLEGHPVCDGEHPIAMAGKVYVWCDADANGAIQPGARLTTSKTPGYAMRATDRSRCHGAVIGKAMTELKQGRGLVLLLVQPQ